MKLGDGKKKLNFTKFCSLFILINTSKEQIFINAQPKKDSFNRLFSFSKYFNKSVSHSIKPPKSNRKKNKVKEFTKIAFILQK